MRPVLLAVAATVVASAVSARPADACSPPPCWPGFFLPGDTTNLPANAPGFLWRPMSSTSGGPAIDPANVTIYIEGADPTATLPFTATPLDGGDYLLVPAQPLVEGTTYLLVDATECWDGSTGPMAAITAGAPAPLPQALGALVVFNPQVDTLTVATASGTCDTDVTAAMVSVQLAPSTDAVPWLDVLELDTLVDGQPWHALRTENGSIPPGESWAGRGWDVIYSVCESSDPNVSHGTTEGRHTVTMRATIPGADGVIVATSDPFELDCGSIGDPPDDPPIDDGAACNAGASSGGAGWLVTIALGFGFSVRRRRKLI